jgi:hypothetical protein
MRLVQIVEMKTLRRLRTMAAEKKFEEQIKEFLKSKGIYPLGTPSQKMKAPMIGYYEKRWGNAYTGGGLPDMHIVIHGISVEVEIKAAKGRPSELQKFKMEQILNSGGIGLILYPNKFEEFKRVINGLCDSEPRFNVRRIYEVFA